MTTTHTPGPWTAMPHKPRGPDAKRFQVRGPDDAGPTARFVCENARLADARLIAAAPELLEALERLVDYVFLNKDYDAVSYAEYVIAKAEGRAT